VTSAPPPHLLVTGASGFLGRHLLEAREGRPTAVLVRSREAWAAWPWVEKLSGIHVVEGSLHEPERWSHSPALSQIGSVVHLAAHVEHSRGARVASFRANVDGTASILEVAGGWGARLIFISTSGTVGCFRDPRAIAFEDSPYCEAEIAGWPYYASKLEAERRARARAEQLGMQLVIVRPPVMLGPGDHRLRSSGHVLRVLEGRLPFRLPGGIGVVDVRDVAAALIKLIEHSDPARVYHLPGWNGSLDDFFEEIARLAGRRLPGLRPPAALLRALASGLSSLPDRFAKRLGLPDPVLLEMGTRFWGVGSRLAQADLGHTPRELRDTLTDALAWLKTQGHTH